MTHFPPNFFLPKWGDFGTNLFSHPLPSPLRAFLSHKNSRLPASPSDNPSIFCSSVFVLVCYLLLSFNSSLFFSFVDVFLFFSYDKTPPSKNQNQYMEIWKLYLGHGTFSSYPKTPPSKKRTFVCVLINTASSGFDFFFLK